MCFTRLELTGGVSTHFKQSPDGVVTDDEAYLVQAQAKLLNSPDKPRRRAPRQSDSYKLEGNEGNDVQNLATLESELEPERQRGKGTGVHSNSSDEGLVTSGKKVISL